jgi:hypothetical protein
MLALDLLRLAFAQLVLCGFQMTRVSPPIIREESHDPKGLQQGFQLQKHLVLASAKDIRQDNPGAMIDRMPEPSRLLLLAHKAPHFVDFCFVNSTDDDVHAARVHRVDEGLVDGEERRSFFLTRE